MALFINSNPTSLRSQRQLGQNQHALAKNLERLSSGLRINSAADDAAGLAISDRMGADIRSFQQAERNALDGISALSTADGAYNEVTGLLIRMRELSVQSANGTLNASDQDNLDTEFQALSAEITRIGAVTEFNGTALLNGTYDIDIQVGIHAIAGTDNIDVVISEAATATGLSLDTLDIGNGGLPSTAITTIDLAIDKISTQRAKLGAITNRLEVSISNLSTARENTTASRSRIRDVDVAAETAAMTRNQILSQAGVSMLAQANQMPQLALSLLGGN